MLPEPLRERPFRCFAGGSLSGRRPTCWLDRAPPSGRRTPGRPGAAVFTFGSLCPLSSLNASPPITAAGCPRVTWRGFRDRSPRAPARPRVANAVRRRLQRGLTRGRGEERPRGCRPGPGALQALARKHHFGRLPAVPTRTLLSNAPHRRGSLGTGDSGVAPGEPPRPRRARGSVSQARLGLRSPGLAPRQFGAAAPPTGFDFPSRKQHFPCSQKRSSNACGPTCLRGCPRGCCANAAAGRLRGRCLVVTR